MKKGILTIGEIYKPNLKIGTIPGREYLEKLFKSGSDKVTEIILKEFFGGEKIKILNSQKTYRGGKIGADKSERYLGSNGRVISRMRLNY